jgi:hypothetical protein
VQTTPTAEDVPGMSGPQIVLMANTPTDSSSTLQPSLHYGGSYLMNAVQAIQIQQQAVTADGPCDELQKYLKSGAEPTTDVVGWWGVSFFLIFECAHMLMETRSTPGTQC